MLRGALAAAVTPLRDGGESLDEDAFVPYADFLVAGGLDGLLALGTTGEGILLSTAERKRVAELFVGAAGGRLQVAVHCGAQTTAETAALAEHAAAAGADAVAVIGPPYYVLDERALAAHLLAAARACEPLPFYLYEFRARTGYSIPVAVIERLRLRAPNLAGLKVSNTPFEALEPYLIEGMDVFVGAEALAARGLERGAAGVVSGLAAAFPEEVAALVREPSAERAAEVGELRTRLDRQPFHAALKLVLQARGVPILDEVRAPLRRLVKQEREELLAWLASS
ncbi:MAG: dihydrodipicolinate synthase family protein [Gaiellaceae bacterium]